MAFDFKKEYKEFYLPSGKPGIVTVPPMKYLAVRGYGNPNEEEGDYKKAVGLLYALAYTIKMSPKGGHMIEGYFEYVVPPLEGLWYQEGISGVDYSRKDEFHWISMIRVPDFVTEDVFQWAVREAERKKNIDVSKAELLTADEGLCVQIMHVGAFDDEPATVKVMDGFALESGYELDFSPRRMHHEIYLSDPRRCAPEKLKTVIRHPIRRRDGLR